MTVTLPPDLESSLRAEVDGGRFASLDDALAEAVRLLLRDRGPAHPDAPDPVLGSIGAMADAAEELDEIVADAMRRRREETWRTLPGD